MTKYPVQEMGHLFMTSDTTMGESYILLKIGPVWSIAHCLITGETIHRYFDEETAREEWEKLKEVKRVQAEEKRERSRN
jgi:hypothetical protein